MFTMSAQNGAVSRSMSDGILMRLHIPLAFGLVIRKFAHFTEYFILAALFCWNKPDNRWLCIIFCVLFACSDEFHQLYVSGRSGQIMDIFIDAGGSAVYLLLHNLIVKNC